MDQNVCGSVFCLQERKKPWSYGVSGP